VQYALAFLIFKIKTPGTNCSRGVVKLYLNEKVSPKRLAALPRLFSK
jgi:hypothetical protein